MLGGMLRALLAMCFSNVVFPLLKKQPTVQRTGAQYVTLLFYYCKDRLMTLMLTQEEEIDCELCL